MEAQYIHGTLNRKLQLLGLLVLLLALALVYSYLIPHILTSNAGNDILTITYINMLITVVLLPAYIVAVLYCYRFGNKVRISQQYPPPDSEMPFTIKVVNGKKALIQAYASYGVSLMIMLHVMASLSHEIYMAIILKGNS